METTNGLNFFVNISSIYNVWGKRELFSKLQGLENQSFGGKPHQIGGKIGGFWNILANGRVKAEHLCRI